MKATREQCLALASAAGFGSTLATRGNNELYIEGAVWTEELETLVHLAQQFTLDQLKRDGGEVYVGEVPYWRIPETLE